MSEGSAGLQIQNPAACLKHSRAREAPRPRHPDAQYRLVPEHCLARTGHLGHAIRIEGEPHAQVHRVDGYFENAPAADLALPTCGHVQIFRHQHDRFCAFGIGFGARDSVVILEGPVPLDFDRDHEHRANQTDRPAPLVRDLTHCITLELDAVLHHKADHHQRHEHRQGQEGQHSKTPSRARKKRQARRRTGLRDRFSHGVCSLQISTCPPIRCNSLHVARALPGSFVQAPCKRICGVQ